jgi:Ca2+/Na+ antiporter
MNPVYREDATKGIQDLIADSEHQHTSHSEQWIEERKKQLILKMKEDTDNKEYPIMLNGLIIVLAVMSLIHIINGIFLFAIVLVAGIAYYVYTTKKLKKAIFQLQEHQNNIDQYMYDGYLIKDTRFTAVKFAFLLFFPIICYMGFRLIEDTSYTLPVWQYVITAVTISSVAWFMFFSDDQAYLEQLDSEIKGLLAISKQEESNL